MSNGIAHTHGVSLLLTRRGLTSDLVMTTYSAVSLSCGTFSHKYSPTTPIARPRSRGMAAFLCPASDWYSASVPVIFYVISYNIWPHFTTFHSNMTKLGHTALRNLTSVVLNYFFENRKLHQFFSKICNHWQKWQRGVMSVLKRYNDMAYRM